MKKLLLVFMSMFFVLGTSMAQDKEEGPKDFNSPIVRPDSKTPQTSVTQIYLTFSKDVVVTLPESGIPIVNTETNTTILIDSLFVNEWMPKTDVVFMFEQELVADEKGEEWRCKTITAPGTYSYTIPAGCIKSVDGEEFPETTFTFSIVGTFPITNYSPTQSTENINEIVLTFEKEITAVNLPKEYPLTVFNSSWASAATINEATISEDKKNVTLVLSEPLTAGQYMLSINEGVLTSADGINAYSDLYFRVIDLTPRFVTNYQDGDKVEALGDLEITFENIAEFDWAEDAGVELYTPTKEPIKGETSKSEDGTRLIVSFEGDLTEEGDYMYYIPAGSFTMDGVLNEEIQILVNLERLVIEPLKVETVLPEESTVNEICKIVVKFNQPIQLSMDENWQQISREIQLTCGEETYTLTYASGNSASATNQVEYLVNAVWNGFEYESTPITAEGTYTLNLADIIVDYAGESYIDQWGGQNMKWNASGSVEGIYSWTIGGEGTGIKAVGAEDGGQVIYDLLGRCVEKIVGAGIYIVDGKKVIVK